MDPLLVFPEPASPDVVRALELSGYAWKAATTISDERLLRPESDWPAAVLIIGDDPRSVHTLGATLRADCPNTPLLVLVPGSHLHDLGQHRDLFDDFCLLPFHPAEFKTRLDLLLAQGAGATQPDGELVTYGPLVINLATYQAAIDGEPIDLTYMEYELLKHFAMNPGRVFSRQVLLSEVWGYDYYGGARTVDVHVRRLRAKLGEGHAGLITTVRSVGYRFGQGRWDRSANG